MSSNINSNSSYYLDELEKAFFSSKIKKKRKKGEAFSREEIAKRLFSSEPFVGTEEEYIDYLFDKDSYIGSLAKKVVINSDERYPSFLPFIRMMRKWGIWNLNKVLIALQEENYLPQDYYYLSSNSKRRKIFDRIIEEYSIENHSFVCFLFAVYISTA